jgi:hypothetical protein
MGSTAIARVAQLRARAGDLLTPLGLAEMPDTPQVFPQPPHAPHDWLVLRLAEDPAYQVGELAIPPPQRRMLRELDRRGVVFDELFIAHEIAKAGLHGSLKPSAKELSDLLSPASADKPRSPALKALSVLTEAFIVGGKVLGAAAVSPLLLAAADPVLIGAVVAGGQCARPVAAFFEVVRWDVTQPVRRKS